MENKDYNRVLEGLYLRYKKKEIAEMLDISYNYLNSIENGNRPISKKVMLKIDHLLKQPNIDNENLFNNVKDKDQPSKTVVYAKDDNKRIKEIEKEYEYQIEQLKNIIGHLNNIITDKDETIRELRIELEDCKS